MGSRVRTRVTGNSDTADNSGRNFYKQSRRTESIEWDFQVYSASEPSQWNSCGRGLSSTRRRALNLIRTGSIRSADWSHHPTSVTDYTGIDEIAWLTWADDCTIIPAT